MERKTVLITGAARRIGRTLALHLGRQGWDVAIHCHRSRPEAETLLDELAALGRKGTIIVADLADDSALRAVVPTATKALGPLTCLINNASLFERDHRDTFSAQSWRAHHDTNLYAPAVLSNAFAAQLDGDCGHIINLADATAEWSVAAEFFSYGMSKLGLLTLTQQLALLFAPHIRVNAIALGPTLPGAQDGPDTFATLAKKIPLRHTSSPDEVCAAVDFILSAPSFTGQIISLGGGITLASP